ncbi:MULTISPECIES: acetyl-CoA carboxylase biotin carboxyl carrier protein [Bacillaceae]|uniref:acetyl-CoA carboxylase biotin carboxyl carrier protein n=1 Tax=Bacillaceae TaxID=186817 RepID=UPI000E75F4F9|nr:acetyl-CoA carboxylase biotin carboxyl carrier protein [Bacillus sp. PK3_68]RJS59657.1 acetyl-CoA carboxylase, biotin carboxyl carrier protein [Bacillus sp. PK3_68]
MKVQEIRELIKLVDQSSIEEFVFESEGSKIEMKKNSGVTYSVAPQAAPVQEPVQAAPVQAAPVAPAVVEPAAVQETPTPEAPKPAASNENLHKITSPMVGTFYESPSPDADPYVKAGSKVSADTVVCIVEAMKLFNEIEAEVDGEIVEVLVKDGQLVEYGQPLFLVKP